MKSLSEVRTKMAQQNLAAVVIFSSDPHLCENVNDYFNERKRLLGFCGSAGVVTVTQNEVYFRTDSRYFLECERLFAGTKTILVREGEDESLPQWLAHRFQSGEKIGINFSSVPHVNFEKIVVVCNAAGIQTVPFPLTEEQKFVPPLQPLTAVSSQIAADFGDKLRRLRSEMKGEAILLTAPDTVAWLTGFRQFCENREDIFFYAWAWVTKTEVVLFSDSSLPTPLFEMQQRPYGDFFRWIQTVRSTAIEYSENELNESLFRLLQANGNRLLGDGLRLRLLQAVKSERELQSMKKACATERRILFRFQKWLNETVVSGKAVSEWEVANRLEMFRCEEATFRGRSFDTIAAFGENGAVVHYHPEEKTAAAVQGDGILLLDCGIHTSDGTTDMTRVFWLGCGQPPADAVADCTAVLKAHIALATAVFTRQTTGVELDAIARNEAARGGVEYGHGTGHGVGWLNCVHEPPFSISRSCSLAVQPGLVVSIEPGCYRKGCYGIRLENLYAVVTADEEGERLRFERLTDFPFDRALIDESLLTESEKKWLDENNFVKPSSSD